MQEKPPARLTAASRRLWCEVVDQYELRQDELTILEDICRETDLITKMDAELRGREMIVAGSTGQDTINPLVPELRAHRAARAGLWAKLKLPDAAGLPVNAQRTGGQTRWARAHGSAA